MLGVILFTGLIFQMASVGMPKIFQARLGDVIGTSALAAGTLVSIVFGVSALGQIVGGVLADRYDERMLYPISYGAAGAACCCSPPRPSARCWWWSWRSPMTVQTGTQPIENCLLARYTPEAWRATVYGLKFVLALGLSALGRAADRADRRRTGSVDGVLLAMAGLQRGGARRRADRCRAARRAPAERRRSSRPNRRRARATGA